MPLPTYNSANVKSFFENASVSDINSFASDATSNYVGAWQSRFDFAGKQIYLIELGLTPSHEKAYFIANLGHISSSKAASVSIDFSGFSFTSDGDNSGILSKIETKIHTDWTTVPVAPYIVLTSFWITKDEKK